MGLCMDLGELVVGFDRVLNGFDSIFVHKGEFAKKISLCKR